MLKVFLEVAKEEALANIREAIVERIMSLAEERVLGLVQRGRNKRMFSLRGFATSRETGHC